MTAVSITLIWVWLLALLAVSVALGYLGNVGLATTLIFSIAIIKAFLVGAYYMRLKWEPRFILWILFGGVGCVLILYFTLMPDIVFVYGD